MKKYHIDNCGCDDTTEFDIELNEDELKIILKFVEANNKVADYCCKPEIYVYEMGESKKVSWEAKPLNKNYEELKEKE